MPFEMKSYRSTWKFVIGVSGSMALIFAILGGWRDAYSLWSVTFFAVSGAILGAILVPEIKPEAFRYPALWQMSFAILGCVAIAAAVAAPAEGYMLAVLVGSILGYLAPYWIKHVQGP